MTVENGPEEMGWRTTAQNLNLNRDFLKADAPEMQAWLGLWQAWLPDFARAVYHANFATGGDISDPELIADILSAVAQPAEDLLEQANCDDVKKRLREQTARAAKLGIFGAPTFVVGNELFWGNDRMGDAIVWARTGGAA